MSALISYWQLTMEYVMSFIYLFFKQWAILGLFLFIFCLFKQYKFYNKLRWKNVHLESGTGIQTRDLLISPFTTRPGLLFHFVKEDILFFSRNFPANFESKIGQTVNVTNEENSFLFNKIHCWICSCYYLPTSSVTKRRHFFSIFGHLGATIIICPKAKRIC